MYKKIFAYNSIFHQIYTPLSDAAVKSNICKCLTTPDTKKVFTPVFSKYKVQELSITQFHSKLVGYDDYFAVLNGIK